MIEVRELGAEELGEAARFGDEFLAMSGYPGKFDPVRWTLCWRAMLAGGTGVMLGLFEDGRVIGALGGAWMHDLKTGTKQTAEICWWVRPEKRGHGLRLFKAYEAWARRIGARVILAGHLAGHGRLGQYLRRRGYKPYEVAYLKEI